MADELKQHFELDVELVKSSGGRFEISFDGDLIFSKAQTGRFPQPGEIAALIKEKI
ncbi:MAG TPA: SelT/SelW/SelH family protein [Caldithrix abyssi]|uniref:SelT/SelW/SelH family protein n=1 Tax=Caldithrix abyssi TaxID=187145 RepID=A0A7V4UDZ9_CALAY|nr:SelT/SelW/SelH family protein [Caldithrix abyssi]